jgi:perosamine synthetase
MRIGRTLPPAAAPLEWRDLVQALRELPGGAGAVAAREAEIRREFGVDHVFLVSSGSAALALSLLALKALSCKRDVVLPAYTCYSVPAAVLEAGLRPVLIDRTRSLCAVHRIFVLEDAAQAMGGEVGGRKLGTLGDIGIFSFGRGKNITCGSGGAILTRSPAIAAALTALYRALPPPTARDVAIDLIKLLVMAIFIRPRLYWIPALLPFLRLGETIFPADVPLRRLGAVKAVLLAGWRRRLAESNTTRSEVAADFSRRLRLQAGDRRACLRIPLVAPTPRAKDRVQALGRARGLGVSAAYPAPVSEIPQIREVFAGQRFPAAEHVAARLVTIPTHKWVSERDRQAIVDLLLGAEWNVRQLEA